MSPVTAPRTPASAQLGDGPGLRRLGEEAAVGGAAVELKTLTWPSNPWIAP
jgi:hypothetical protein